MARDSWEWSKKIVWSNLYKIAPDGANPEYFEKEAQLSVGINLVKMEIDELEPKYCIVLTNRDWWLPFQKALTPRTLQESDLPSEVVFYEQYNQTVIIVTNRPRFGHSEKYVSQILTLL